MTSYALFGAGSRHAGFHPVFPRIASAKTLNPEYRMPPTMRPAPIPGKAPLPVANPTNLTDTPAKATKPPSHRETRT